MYEVKALPAPQWASRPAYGGGGGCGNLEAAKRREHAELTANLINAVSALANHVAKCDSTNAALIRAPLDALKAQG